MAAGIYDIVIEKGATFYLAMTWKDENGDAYDLSSGYSARMMIRETVDASGDPELELTDDNGRIILGSGTNNIILKIASTNTESLTITSGYYDLEIEVDATGFVTRLLQGEVTISPQVTR